MRRERVAPSSVVTSDDASGVDTCHSECYMGPRPTNEHEGLPTCHSERSKESASYLLLAKADSSPITLLGMTGRVDDFRRSGAKNLLLLAALGRAVPLWWVLRIISRLLTPWARLPPLRGSPNGTPNSQHPFPSDQSHLNAPAVIHGSKLSTARLCVGSGHIGSGEANNDLSLSV